MKRYLVFAGNTFYACGGWSDFEADFDTLDECTEWRDKDKSTNGYGCDWWQVVDTETKQIVKEDGCAQC